MLILTSQIHFARAHDGCAESLAIFEGELKFTLLLRYITANCTCVCKIMIMLLFCLYKGFLQLLLSGYENIPNDNTALVPIPDIGIHAEGTALICRHHITGISFENEIDSWNYISEGGQEVTVNSDIGWKVSREQNNGDVRLERITGVSPLEGTYIVQWIDQVSIMMKELIVSLSTSTGPVSVHRYECHKTRLIFQCLFT